MEDFIRANLGFLTKNTRNFVELVIRLRQEEILTNGERQSLLDHFGSVEDKHLKLYELLITKGENTLKSVAKSQSFLKSVKKALTFSGNNLVAYKLEECLRDRNRRKKFPKIDLLEVDSSSVYLVGKKQDLVKFRDIKSDVKDTVGVMHLKWVEVEARQLESILEQCYRISFLHLDNVKFIGQFKNTVCLPSLKDFVYNDEEDFVEFFSGQNEEDRREKLKSCILFFKTQPDQIWDIDNLQAYHCNIVVSIIGILVVKINRLVQQIFVDMVAHNHFVLEGQEDSPELSFEAIPACLQPRLITKICLKFSITIDAFSFPSAISNCVNLKSIELVKIKVIGRFVERALLPKLSEFFYDDLTDFPDDNEGRKQLDDYLKTTQLKSLLFFDKMPNENWNLADLWNLEVDIKVIIKGITLISIHHLRKELVCGLSNPTHADQILANVGENLKKLALRDCLISDCHVPASLQELILCRVESRNDDLPGLIRNCQSLVHLCVHTTKWVDINVSELPMNLKTVAFFNVFLDCDPLYHPDTTPTYDVRHLESRCLVACELSENLKMHLATILPADNIRRSSGIFTPGEFRNWFRFYNFWSCESFEGGFQPPCQHDKAMWHQRHPQPSPVPSPTSPTPPPSP